MRCAAPLACALALLAPAVAGAQDTEAPPLVPAPPVAPQEPEEVEEEREEREATAPAATGQLPDTGLDAWLVALLGAGLVLSGAGVRLKSADERF